MLPQRQDGSDLPDSTFSDFETSREGSRSLWLRRFFLTGLLLLTVAGLSGILGVRSAEVSTRGSGWTLRLEYASVARAGLDVPWAATVVRRGGFRGPVTLGLSGSYLDIYETQAFHPEPAAARRDAGMLYLEFDPPEGEEMVVSYDAYIQPASQVGAEGTLCVIDAGACVATVEFETVLLP